MLLPYHGLPSVLVGVLLLLVYATAQQRDNAQVSVSACEAARPRFHDAVALLLLYFLVMYLRTISLRRMVFLPGNGADDTISAIVLSATIVSVFVAARSAQIYHLLPDLSPQEERTVGVSERSMQYIGSSVIVALILLEMAAHVRDAPAKGARSYVPWFFGPRLLVLSIWIGISLVLPLPSPQRKRLTLRAYAWAFAAALFFVRPRFLSLLGLGTFLGLLTYEIATYGAQPLVGGEIDGESVCPYAMSANE